MAMKDDLMKLVRGAAMSLALLLAPPAFAAGLTIGVVAPTRGLFAPLGAQILAGARLAAQADGDIVETVEENCEDNSGAAIADALIRAKARAAIGFLCTESLEGALPKLKDAGIPAITLSVRSPILMEDALKNGWPLLRLAPAEGAEAGKIVEVILRDWAAFPIALIDDGTIHGRELVDAVRRALEERGLKPVFTDTYRPGQEQQIALVRRLRKAGAARLFIGGDRNDVAVIARDAEAEKIDLGILGGDAMRAANQPQPLPDGVLAVALPDYAALASGKPAADALLQAGEQPEGYALPAIAAVEILRQAASAPGEGARLDEAIAAGSYDTPLGRIAFNARRELAVNPFVLQVWRNGAFAVSAVPGE